MGGQDGIRGYIYQTIISVIQFLRRPEWVFFAIEPTTEKEKVDIICEDAGGSQYCHQVKSSINNFTQPEIIRWLTAMTEDVQAANAYHLILIGTVSDSTKGFINSFNKRKEIAGLPEPLQQKRGQISVELLPFHTDMLEAKIRDEMFKFLEEHDYNLLHSSMQYIAGGLIYQFLQFSILGKKVTRQEIEQYILQWVTNNYGKELSKSRSESRLSVTFVNEKERTLLTSLKPAVQTFDENRIIHPQEQKVTALYNEASQIKLPCRTVRDEKLMTTLEQSLLKIWDTLEPCEIYPEWQTFITEKFAQYFNLTIDPSFFNLGNLTRQRTLILPPFGSGFDYMGSDAEKNKRERLHKLYWELKTFHELKEFLLPFQGAFALPLVVNNEGSFDEEVRVSLTFPREVLVLDKDNILLPEDVDALKIIIDNDYFFEVLQPRASSFADEYVSDVQVYFEHDDSISLMNRMNMTNSKELAHQQSRLHRYFMRLFDFEVHQEEDGSQVLQFWFKKINPNEHLLFPSYLLVFAKQDFSIGIEIKSKHNTRIRKGQLTCRIN
jgi:hypothetical protein